ncbi:type II and III secretion system protein [Acidovorax sp. SRB_14]|uniref:type II and III secretion system protein family protein n=1 Tax=Acidovorax sp. SRB_14 TaxID=1962699 RepID=UPI0015665A5C|nr:type II and III secretion system protein family protein [Acidovorax sp. SRB_14]NMM79518.1 type II and III secretion system protein [Acidovorax sp. SRB_14]
MHKKYKSLIFLATLALAGQSFSQDKAVAATHPTTNPTVDQAPRATSGLKPCIGEARVDPPTYMALGKSRVIPLDYPASRMLVGGHSFSRAGRAISAADKAVSGMPANAPAVPAASAQGSDGVADVEITLLSPRELFFLGKKAGSMNVILQSADGRCVVKDIIVTIDPDTLQSKLAELMPEETGIKVKGAENAIVLTGRVSDAIRLDEVMSLATAYGDGKKVVNMLRISTPQQVMLEVKIAEVSKTLLDKFGASVAINRSSDGGANSFSLLSNFLSNGGGLLQALRVGRTALNLDGQKDDGLVRVLAEPNIMAISGQSASFLSGGKIFIPVSQDNTNGRPTITLEEKEFGIGVKFTPTVLDGTRVNLKMVSEVSDLLQTGSPFTSVNGVTSILPSLTVRRADTTVQLNDGQSFVIAGLIKNNVTETIKRFPGLGEVPVMGALFRSTEFQNDQTELLFIVTPRLVKPLMEVPRLPTDNHVVPSRAEVIFNGSLEGAAPASAAPAPAAEIK